MELECTTCQANLVKPAKRTLLFDLCAAKAQPKNRQRLKNRKIKKLDIKLVWDYCLWDSGKWEWWEIILGWIPLEFHGIWSYKT